MKLYLHSHWLCLEFSLILDRKILAPIVLGVFKIKSNLNLMEMFRLQQRFVCFSFF